MWEQGLNLDLFPIEGFITVSAYCKELLSSDGLIHQLKKQNFKVAVVDLDSQLLVFGALTSQVVQPFTQQPSNPPSALPQTFPPTTQFIVTNNVIQQYVKDCPHPSQLISNASGMLINSHPAIDFPRLLPPSYLEVAGYLRLHKQFWRRRNHLSQWVSISIPNTAKKKAFGRLKQKANNKTVLFVSHCGMHGVMEAIRSEVPIVGIPVFLDQKDNLKRLEELGVARGLDKEADANEIDYKENMKLLSRNVKAFGSPLKKAVWLLEHIIETKGAPHLKLWHKVRDYISLQISLP
ncbi:UDP-glucuronosyltransferase 1-1 [Armadillidium vulgare]|nr:UDP-glucuronosyltransferase 1-1 [Armadillidium vulgare]